MASFGNMNWNKVKEVLFPLLMVCLGVLSFWGALTMHSCTMERAFNRCLDKRISSGEIIIMVKPER